MISPYSDICLHLEKEDKDLWEVLREINPEDRSSYIKDILRQTLLTKSAPVQDLNLEKTDSGKLSNDINFSLGDLFTSGSSMSSESSVESTEVPETGTEVNKAPWEHLLFDVIGVEDDEEVLAILNSSEIKDDSRESPDYLASSKSQKTSETAEIPEDSAEQSELYADNQIKTSMYPGLNHLLNQVIGEETDAEIINLIYRREKKEPSS